MPNEEQIRALKEATERELQQLLVDGNADQAAAARQILDASILQDLSEALADFDKGTAAFQSLTAGLRNVIAKVQANPVGDSLTKLQGQLAIADTILKDLKTPPGQPAPPVAGAGATGAATTSAPGGTTLSQTVNAAAAVAHAALDTAAAVVSELGALSRKYESGPAGAAAIGHDSGGGWSYGAYQIATTTGTMRAFLGFLAAGFPELARALEDAGGNDGATSGSPAFKAAWKTLAHANALPAAERAFIESTHYEPYIANLKALGLDVNLRSAAIRDVAWSISVQHGPNNNVCKNALKGRDIASMSDADIINAVYDERSKMDIYFPRLNQQECDAVRNRFIDERKRALAMLPPRV